MAAGCFRLPCRACPPNAEGYANTFLPPTVPFFCGDPFDYTDTGHKTFSAYDAHTDNYHKDNLRIAPLAHAFDWNYLDDFPEYTACPTDHERNTAGRCHRWPTTAYLIVHDHAL